MDIILDKKDTTNASIKVTLSEADYQPKVEEKLKEYSKKAQIKGFRPGKVPPALIKKMYGKSIMVDEINNLLTSSVNSYIKDNKLPIVGDPLPEVEQAATIDWDNQKSFEFSYSVGLVPEFTYDLNSLKLNDYNVKLSDEELAETIDNLQKRFGEFSTPETTEEGDFITGSLKQADGPFQKDQVFLTLSRVKKDSLAPFLGVAKDATIAFDIKEVFEKPDYIAHLTGLPQQEADALSGKFELTVKEIQRSAPSELNQDFFNKVLGPGEVDSEEAFRAKLREVILENYKNESDKLLAKQIQEQLVTNTAIELPNEFLKRWLVTANENVTLEQIEQEYDQYVKELKWSLIKNKIAEDTDIKVEHEHVISKTKELIKMQFGNMGIAEEDDEMLTNYANNFLKAEKGKNYMNIFNQVFADKITEQIRSSAPVTAKEVTSEEFKKENQS